MNIDFAKSDGLVPVIVQDADTLQVLMLGYTNEQAWQITLETGNVTFWSRSRGELWIRVRPPEIICALKNIISTVIRIHCS